jgi:putative FmdB family regulatory protein
MPTYEYACPKCGIVEAFQSIKEDALTTCPQCKKAKVHRMISTGGGVIFKGSGFWETDYNRSSDYASKTKAEKTGSEKTDSGKTSSDSGKDSAKSDGKKSEKKSGSAKDTPPAPQPQPKPQTQSQAQTKPAKPPQTDK